MDYITISIFLTLLSSTELSIYFPNSSCTYLPDTKKKYESVYSNSASNIILPDFHYDISNFIRIYPTDFVINKDITNYKLIPIKESYSYISCSDYKNKNIILDGLKRYEKLNCCDYSFQNFKKCEPFLLLIEKIDYLDSVKLFFRNDSLKAKAFYKGHEYSIKFDFECPDMVMVSTFKEIDKKDTLVINDTSVEDAESISNFIKG